MEATGQGRGRVKVARSMALNASVVAELTDFTACAADEFGQCKR